MFKNVSWASYAYSIALLLVLYYILIFVFYYYLELRRLLSATKHTFNSKEAFDSYPSPVLTETEQSEGEGTPLFNFTKELIALLKEVIEKSAYKKTTKEDLTKELQAQIQSFIQLRGTAFQIAVNNFVSIESQVHCSIILSEEELNMLWEKS